MLKNNQLNGEKLSREETKSGSENIPINSIKNTRKTFYELLKMHDTCKCHTSFRGKDRRGLS